MVIYLWLVISLSFYRGREKSLLFKDWFWSQSILFIFLLECSVYTHIYVLVFESNIQYDFKFFAA
jgi:hypothetical protein